MLKRAAVMAASLFNGGLNMQLDNLVGDDRTFTVSFDDDVELKIRHITRDELRSLYKKATTSRFVNNVKTDEFDSVKADCLLGRAAIKGWSGVKMGDNAAPCTPENIDLLMTRHNRFAKFINDICIDIDALVQQGISAERKNL
jgi:hypothetical protein